MQVVTRSDAKEFPKVRLVTEEGNEIVTIDKALAAADEAGLDLVCVSPESSPPVCRIDDFKKLRFESKKTKTRRQRTSTVKEIQIKVNISDHDLQTKLKSIEKFLARGDKVKLSIRLKGREREHPERATELMEKVIKSVPCKVSHVPGPTTLAMLEAAK